MFDEQNPGHDYNPGEMVPLLHRLEQQKLLATLGPTHRKLHEWASLPGRFSMVEACLRAGSKGQRNGLRAAFNTLYSMQHAQAFTPIDAQLVRCCVSLVSTIKKLRQLNIEGDCDAYPRAEFLPVENSLQKALEAVNCWVLGEGFFPAAGSTRQSVSESLRMQVFAILSLIWVDEQNARIRDTVKLHGSYAGPPPQLPRCHHVDACHVHLADVTQGSLLDPDAAQRKLPSAAKQQLRVAKLWDGFARASFHGRLLPGCSHLRCTSLAGVSEAALHTQLCSGCRRVRYCSRECQRAAWVGGGHGLVCGKGEWAIVHTF